MRWSSCSGFVRSRFAAFAIGLIAVNALGWFVWLHQPANGFAKVAPRRTHAATKPVDLLRLVSAAQSDYDPAAHTVGISFTFTHPVDPSEVLPRLQALEDDAHRVKLTATEHGHTPVLVLHTTTEPMARIEAGENAPLQIALLKQATEASVISTDTLGDSISVPIATDLRVSAVSAGSPTDRAANLVVQFSGPIDPAVLHDRISVAPAVPFTILTEGSNTIVLAGDFAAATRYAVKLTDRDDQQDRSAIPRGGVCTVFVPDRAGSVWFDHASGSLGSAGRRRVTVHAVNVSEMTVTVTKMYDDNVVVWRNAVMAADGGPSHRRRRFFSDESDTSSIDRQSRVIATRKIKLDGKKNARQDCDLSLDDLIPGGFSTDGVFRIDVSGKTVRELAGNVGENERESVVDASTLLTLSDIALTAKHSVDASPQPRSELLVWATSLHTASPLPGIHVRGFTAENQLVSDAVTDENGIARLLAVTYDGHATRVVLGADDHQQWSWLDLRDPAVAVDDPSVHGASWDRGGYDAFVYADRGVYRPGETVYLRTVVRGSDWKTPRPFPVAMKLIGPDQRAREHVNQVLDADGSAHWSVTLPPESPTGQWSMVVGLPGDNDVTFGRLTFSVEEFIPDRIRVRSQFENISADGRHPLNNGLTATVGGDYLFGQPASGLNADLICRLDPTPFDVKAFHDWTLNDDAEVAADRAAVHAGGVEKRFENLTLDEHGLAKQSVSCSAMLSKGARPAGDKGPWTLTMTGEVRETGGRAVADSTSIRIDGVSRYVALRPVDPNDRAVGRPIQLDVRLLHADGSADESDAELACDLQHVVWNTSWSTVNGRYTCRSTRRLEAVGKQNLSMRNGSGRFAVTIPYAGSFALSIVDPATQRTISVATFFDGGRAGNGSETADSVPQEHPESLQVMVRPHATFSTDELNQWKRPLSLPTDGPLAVIASRIAPIAASNDGFSPSEPVAVTVRSPFAGTLLLTLETDHVLQSQIIRMTESMITIPLTLQKECAPNAFVSAEVVRAIDSAVPWWVHRASGVAAVPIDSEGHRLSVAIHTPPLIKPEESLPVSVRITDRLGKPVSNSAVTIAVVDEGICQLTRYITPDPFGYFTRARSLDVRTNDTYSDLMPDTDHVGDTGGDGERALERRHSTPVAAKRVRSLALVSTVLRTDTDGVASLNLPMPDFIGKARVMVTAYKANQFGAGQQFVTARSDLIVQSSWPRFVSPTDRFRVPLVIFNSGKSDGEAVVKMAGNSLLSIAGNVPTVHVPAGQSASVNVDVTTADACGVADVRTEVTLGQDTFHETISLPVRPAASRETSTDSQLLTPGTALAFLPPTGFLQGQRTLSVRVSPQPQLNLPQGLDYLDRYPYGCSEQTVATAFPLVFLPELFPSVTRQESAEKINVALDRLVMLQNSSGGLPMWAGGKDWPWSSVFAAHFCVIARRAGYTVPAEFQDRLMDYVRELLAASGDDPERMETQAYACYVLALAGKPDIGAMSRLTDILTRPLLPDTLPPTAQTAFHLAAAWAATNDPTPGDVLMPRLSFNPRGDRRLSRNVDSPVREQAVMLSTLLEIKPSHPQIPKLAAALAEAGRKGEWRSTQEAAFAVLALGEYAKQTKSAKPFNHAELLSDGVVLAASDHGQSLLWTSDQVPTGPLSVRIDGEPAARGWLDWMSDGVPLKPNAAAVSQGLSIEKTVQTEAGDPIEKSTLRSGQLVRVVLQLKSPAALDGIVIEDLLPAGLEPENPRLEGSRHEQATGEDRSSFPANRQDFRDDRVVVFGSVSNPGTYRCSYLARAVTSGTFVVPAVRAECMYDLATHATSAGGQVMTIAPSAAPPAMDVALGSAR